MKTEVINQFIDLAKAGENVKCYNTYKGIPICFDAEFIKISHGAVTLRVHKYQALCMKKSGQTILRHELLTYPVQAFVVQVDFIDMSVTLNDFNFVNSTAGNRNTIRVEPDREFSVVLSNGSVVHSQAIDVSEGGFGVFLKSPFYIDTNFGVDKLVGLEFRYPQERRLVAKLRGVVANVNSDQVDDRYRLGIRIFPDDRTRQYISEYVNQRQVEILRELEALHQLVQKSITA